MPEATLRGWFRDGIVEWWGWREEMPDVMAQYHVVCQPSIYGEGVPKVLLAAAAAGRLVVATDTAGCREVVADGVDDLLVRTGDGAALADGLQRLIERPEERKAMGVAARTRAEAGFGITSVVQSTLDIYSDLFD